MNLLFSELLYPRTHARSNSFYIECLAKLNMSLFVLTPQDFYYIENDDVKQIYVPEFSMSGGKVSYRINENRYVNYIIDAVYKYNIDTVILASGDYITIAILTAKLRNVRLFLIHHAELDVLEKNKIKNIFFSTYKNKINHLVFEDYIKDYITNSLGVNDSLVSVMPHSLNDNGDIKPREESEYKMVGLSNSNDDELIGNIIEFEKQYHLFSLSGFHIILKSKNHKYSDGYLNVINSYLTEYEYKHYISSTEYVLLPFSRDFGYRESGTLMDALSNRKKVIGVDIPLMKYYKEKYPHTCYIYDDVQTIISILQENQPNQFACDQEFEHFRNMHSIQNYMEIMRKALNV